MDWRFWKREQTGFGSTVQASPGPTIEDGLTYSLPVLAPETLRSRMTPEAWGQYLHESAASTFRFQFDTPQRGPTDEPFMPPTEDPLCEWPITTREYVLEQCHSAVSRNPIAKRAVRYTASFVVGEGFNLTCKHPDIEALLNDFIDHPDNAIRTYERQAPVDLATDGELFLRLFVGDAAQNEEAGAVIAVPQRPWECRWIETEPGFFRRPLFYRFEYRRTRGDSPSPAPKPQETTDVPGDRIIHCAINRHAYELRGRPEIYPALPWLRAHKEFLENRARQNHWRSVFLWFVQVKNASSQVIAAVAARWKRPPAPGSISVESDAVSVQPLTNPVNANDAAEDGRQLKLMNAVAFGLPEYFLADGSNANLASSTSQQLPALMTFADMQYTLVEQLWTPLFHFVLEQAVKAGRLKASYPECDVEGEPIPGAPPVNTLDGFSVTYRPVSGEDMAGLANALHIALMDEAVSIETYSTRLGFDYGIEAKRIAAQRKQELDEIAAGLRPPLPGIPSARTGADEADEQEADTEGEEDENEPSARQ